MEIRLPHMLAVLAGVALLGCGASHRPSNEEMRDRAQPEKDLEEPGSTSVPGSAPSAETPSGAAGPLPAGTGPDSLPPNSPDVPRCEPLYTALELGACVTAPGEVFSSSIDLTGEVTAKGEGATGDTCHQRYERSLGSSSVSHEARWLRVRDDQARVVFISLFAEGLELPVAVGDRVSLSFDKDNQDFAPSRGQLSLRGRDGTLLFWLGEAGSTAELPAPSEFAITRGAERCYTPLEADGCVAYNGYDMVVTHDGREGVLSTNEQATLGGYRVASGGIELASPSEVAQCDDAFVARAVAAAWRLQPLPPDPLLSLPTCVQGPAGPGACIKALSEPSSDPYDLSASLSGQVVELGEGEPEAGCGYSDLSFVVWGRNRRDARWVRIDAGEQEVLLTSYGIGELPLAVGDSIELEIDFEHNEWLINQGQFTVRNDAGELLYWIGQAVGLWHLELPVELGLSQGEATCHVTLEQDGCVAYSRYELVFEHAGERLSLAEGMQGQLDELFVASGGHQVESPDEEPVCSDDSPGMVTAAAWRAANTQH